MEEKHFTKAWFKGTGFAGTVFFYILILKKNLTKKVLCGAAVGGTIAVAKARPVRLYAVTTAFNTGALACLFLGCRLASEATIYGRHAKLSTFESAGLSAASGAFVGAIVNAILSRFIIIIIIIIIITVIIVIIITVIIAIIITVIIIIVIVIIKLDADKGEKGDQMELSQVQFCMERFLELEMWVFQILGHWISFGKRRLKKKR